MPFNGCALADTDYGHPTASNRFGRGTPTNINWEEKMAEDEFCWEFPSASKCDLKGLNDSGVETFRGDTISSLAREICQNSLDAAVKTGDGSVPDPVEVEFARFEIPTREFPALDEFWDAMERSADFWKANVQATKFFSELKSVLAAPTLPFLRISDANTTGLTGVQEPDLTVATAWRSLVMSSGVSDKDESSGGSFGIGKYAAFSCSQFRTVFYATKTIDGKEGFQGVSRLVTFKTENDEFALGTGFLGQSDVRPLPRWFSPDTIYERSRPGTDIFIPAFAGGESFRADIISSVLEGFLYAIWMKRLVVTVNDGEEIVRIDKVWLERAYRDANPLFEGVRHHYEVLKTPPGKWRVREFPELGAVRLALKNGKDLDKRIAMVRQPGMLIFKKDRFRSHVSFTGVLVVEGALNGVLRDFENPQHTKWEEKRCPSKVHLLKDIYDFCRDAVAEIVKEDLGDEIDSGLGDVLPYSGDDGDPRMEEVLDVKVKGVVEIKSPKRRPRQSGKTTRGGTATGREHGSDTHDNPHTPPTQHDDGQGGSRKVLRREIGHTAFRSICLDKGRGIYKLKIVPEKDAAQAAFDVIAIAEIKSYAAPIQTAALADGTPLTVRDGEISGLSFKKGVPVTVNLTLDYSDYLSLEVACYEYK